MFSCSIFITIQLREIIYLSAIIGPDNCSKQPQWGKKLKIWYTTSLAHTLPFFNSTKMIPVVFNLQNSCNLKIFSLTALYSDLQPAGRNAARVIQAPEKNCAFLQEHPLCWSTQLCLLFNSTSLSRSQNLHHSEDYTGNCSVLHKVYSEQESKMLITKKIKVNNWKLEEKRIIRFACGLIPLITYGSLPFLS